MYSSGVYIKGNTLSNLNGPILSKFNRDGILNLMRSAVYPYPQNRSFVEQALISVLLGIFTFIVFCSLFVIGFQIWNAGRIYPGVTVSGIEVGGLSSAEAAAKIDAEITFPKKGTILLQDGTNVWLAKPQELGLFLDPGASATAAFKVGRSNGLFNRLETQLFSWLDEKPISPTMVFDQRLAYYYLSQLSSQINKPVIEASLEMQGTEVIAKPGQVGRVLDVDASLAVLAAQVQTLRDGVVPLVITETAPGILDASAQADEARKILSQPLTITLPEGQNAEGNPWTFDQSTLASMLIVQRVSQDQNTAYEIEINNDMLISFLTNLAPQLVQYPQNARFIFNDDTRQLELIENAVIGRTLNVEKSLQAIQTGIKNGEHQVTLVLDTSDPEVTDSATAESLGITELVSAQSSYFYGSSADRVQNIEAAASRFHGLLVPPYSTFSMADALGNISLDNGYAEAIIIVGGQSIKGVGGGVCQVSTTLFRTAFFGGYPIVERHAHAYRVSYYEKVAGNHIDSSLAGLDATVYVPLVDFKFTNDSASWLLMETYVNPSASSITWKFYSTSDGRTVDWNTTGPINNVDPPEPKYKENPDLSQGEIRQVDWAANGADVSVTRTVTRNGQAYLNDTINTHYQAWQAVYEYGPGTEIPEQPPDSGH